MDPHLHSETPVAPALVKATGWNRLRGLIGRPPPDPGTALLFERCRSVHGFFMRYPVDVVFVDSGMTVVRVASLRPWRVLWCRGANHALELREGEARRLGIVPGNRL